MLEWCSIVEMTISSPSFSAMAPKLDATRLIPSVAPPVNTISLHEAALICARTVSRAASYSSVDRVLR